MRSMRIAAEKFHLAPSALTIQLKQLEDSLGHRLLERSGRGVTPTEAGRLALDYAEMIFRAGEELADLIRLRGIKRRAELRESRCLLDVGLRDLAALRGDFYDVNRCGIDVLGLPRDRGL
jgi:DNA-binding transcriptional LysR family regulator